MKKTTLTLRQHKDLLRYFDQESPHHISSELKEQIIASGEALAFSRGEIIIREGEVNTNVYILVEGLAYFWHWDGNTEKAWAFSSPGSVTISFHSYQLGMPASESYEACTPCTLLRIGKATFERLLEQSHDFALWWMKNLHMQMFCFEYKRVLFQGSVKERYLSMITGRPEIIKNVKLKHIASYLGTSLQYLSRLRRELEQEGIQPRQDNSDPTREQLSQLGFN